MVLASTGPPLGNAEQPIESVPYPSRTVAQGADGITTAGHDARYVSIEAFC
jgi:hypothetical protein